MCHEKTNHESKDEDSAEDYFIFYNRSSDPLRYIFYIFALSNALEAFVRQTDDNK